MIQITTPVPNDAEAMQNVVYTTWLDTYPNEEAGITVEDIEHLHKDAFTEEVLERVRSAIHNPPEREVLLVAKDEEAVVGVCRIRIHEDLNQLQALYVLPEYQRQGIGGMLLDKALSLVNTTNNTIVHVATYNTKARAFYTKLGFEETDKQILNEKFKMKSGTILPQTELRLRSTQS